MSRETREDIAAGICFVLTFLIILFACGCGSNVPAAPKPKPPYDERPINPPKPPTPWNSLDDVVKFFEGA